MATAFARFASLFGGSDEKSIALLSLNDGKLADLGLTRFQAEQMAGVPSRTGSVRVASVLTAYEHGELGAFAR